MSVFSETPRENPAQRFSRLWERRSEELCPAPAGGGACALRSKAFSRVLFLLAPRAPANSTLTNTGNVEVSHFAHALWRLEVQGWFCCCCSEHAWSWAEQLPLRGAGCNAASPGKCCCAVAMSLRPAKAVLSALLGTDACALGRLKRIPLHLPWPGHAGCHSPGCAPL